MRLAYADPPYVGQAKKHYAQGASYAGEVDHPQLLRRLAAYDGWALSASSVSLRTLLALGPPDARVGAWVKPFAYFKKGVKPAYAWEPVIFKSARSEKEREVALGSRFFCRDWYEGNIWGVTAEERAATTTKGKKRREFCYWVFNLLGAAPGDDLHDIFPGSGSIGRAWVLWQTDPDCLR